MPAPEPKKDAVARPPGKSPPIISNPPERLQKWLAQAGIGSRRTCETWIEEGRVRVNGSVVTELGTKIIPGIDKVTFEGRPVYLSTKRYYVALNKPRNVVCSLSDTHAAKLVTEFVELPSRPLLRPVGRLDADTEGLIFLTDDGDFLYHLTHPKYHIPKTYRASVRGIPTPEALMRLTDGIMLDDGMTAPAENVSIRRSSPENDGRAEIELTIFEGRNRQVRRMFEAIGHPVSRLIRVRIGDVRLTGLASGAWRHLTPKEVEILTKEAMARTTPPKSQQEKKSWHAPRPSRPPRAQSLPNSPRPTRPAQPQTSSNSPKKGSTTA